MSALKGRLTHGIQNEQRMLAISWYHAHMLVYGLYSSFPLLIDLCIGMSYGLREWLSNETESGKNEWNRTRPHSYVMDCICVAHKSQVYILHNHTRYNWQHKIKWKPDNEEMLLGKKVFWLTFK